MSALASQVVGFSIPADPESIRSVATQPPPVRALQQPAAAHHAWIVKLLCIEGPAILHMLWRMLGNEQDVLDAYQDCWCALASLPKPEGVRSGKAFAYRTASNIAVEMIRRKARRREHWSGVVASRPTQAQEDVETQDPAAAEQLREAISRLPQHLRNVVALRDMAKLTYKEVAGVLGIEPGTARVYRRQAVIRLAELFQEPHQHGHNDEPT